MEGFTMGIGKTLSDILDEVGSNPNDLSERTGIAPSTIYSIIKRDNMKADISVLARICKELNVGMNRFYDEYMESESTQPSHFPLTQNETVLLTTYRNLNKDGQEKLLAYADDLSGNDKYKNYTDTQNRRLIYRAARSETNTEHEIIEDDKGLIERLKQIPPVTNEEDL